jgi:hypothetical protein
MNTETAVAAAPATAAGAASALALVAITSQLQLTSGKPSVVQEELVKQPRYQLAWRRVAQYSACIYKSCKPCSNRDSYQSSFQSMFSLYINCNVLLQALLSRDPCRYTLMI